MDYGVMPLLLYLTFIIIGILNKVRQDPECWEGVPAYQFDVKTTAEHEQQAIRSESFIWMNLDE